MNLIKVSDPNNGKFLIKVSNFNSVNVSDYNKGK